MSGPNDSGSGDTPTGDLKFPTLDKAAPEFISPRFRLRINWSTPHLEWRPVLGAPMGPRNAPRYLELDDPLDAVQATTRYILSGAFLFDLQRPNWQDVDSAFLGAPTAPPSLTPSFAQMQAWQDDVFFRRLAASTTFVGPPAPPPPLLTPPVVASPPPSPFYKAPDPSAMRTDSGVPRAGQVGDILKALDGLRVVQDLKNRASDQAKLIVPRLEQEWGQMSLAEKIPAISLSVPIAAGAVATILATSQTRNFLFQKLEGMQLPVPYVPGTKFVISGFGKANSFLVGAPANPNQPQELRFGVTVDLLEAIPAVRRVFR